jgi:hypothetical protein
LRLMRGDTRGRSRKRGLGSIVSLCSGKQDCPSFFDSFLTGTDEEPSFD